MHESGARMGRRLHAFVGKDSARDEAQDSAHEPVSTAFADDYNEDVTGA